MKQRDFEKVCRTIAKMCDRLYLNLDKKELKNKSKLLRYAMIFDNLGKVKLKKYAKSKQGALE